MTLADWWGTPWAKIFLGSLIFSFSVFLINKWRQRRKPAGGWVSSEDTADFADYSIRSDQVLGYARDHSDKGTDTEINNVLTTLAIKGLIHIRAAYWINNELHDVPARIFETYSFKLEEDCLVPHLIDERFHHLKFRPQEILKIWPEKKAKTAKAVLVSVPDMPIREAAEYFLRNVDNPKYLNEYDHENPKLKWALQRIQELAAGEKLRVWGGIDKKPIPLVALRNEHYNFLLDTATGDWYCLGSSPIQNHYLEVVGGKTIEVVGDAWISPYVCRWELESLVPPKSSN